MSGQIMLAIGELQKHRDEIQRIIRDLERIMAGMAKEEAPRVPATVPEPVEKPAERRRVNPHPRLKTGRPKSAETDAAGLAIIQALGQALTPLTPTEIMASTKLERWKVAQLLMKMTEHGAIEKAGYASYQLPRKSRPTSSEIGHETSIADDGVDAQVS